MSDAQQDQAIQHILDALDGYEETAKVKVNSSDVAEYLNAKLVAGSNISITESDSGGVYTLTISSPDQAVVSSGSFNDGYNVLVSATDGTPEFLEEKIVAGDNVTIAKSDEGGREILTISTPDCLTAWGALTDGYYKTKVSGTDTMAEWLSDKIVAGENVTITKSDEGGVEILTIDVSDDFTYTLGEDGYNVKISGEDTLAQYLENKIVAGENVIITKSDEDGVEFLTVSVPDTFYDGYVEFVDMSNAILGGALDGYQIQLGHIYDACDGYAADIGELDIATGHVLTALDGYQSDLGDILTVLDGYQIQLGHIYQACDGYAVDIGELDTAMTHVLAAGDGYQTQITALQNSMNYAQIDIDELDEAVWHLLNASDGYQVQLDNIHTACDGYQEQIDNIYDAADGYATDILELDVAFTHMLTAADGYQLSIDQLSVEAGHLRAACDGYQIQLGHVYDACDGYGDNINLHGVAIGHVLDALDGYFEAGGINQDLIPDTDNAYDLGSDTYRWKTLHVHGDNGAHLHYDGHYVPAVWHQSIVLTLTGYEIQYLCTNPYRNNAVIIDNIGSVYDVNLITGVKTAKSTALFQNVKSLWMDSDGWVYYVSGTDSLSDYGNDTLYKVNPGYTARTKIMDLPGVSTVATGPIGGWKTIKMNHDETVIGISIKTLNYFYYSSTSGDKVLTGERFWNWDSTAKTVGSQIYSDTDATDPIADLGLTPPQAWTFWPDRQFDITKSGESYYKTTLADPNLVRITFAGGSSTIYTDSSPQYDPFGVVYDSVLVDPDGKLYANVRGDEFYRIDSDGNTHAMDVAGGLEELIRVGKPQSATDIADDYNESRYIFYSTQSYIDGFDKLLKYATALDDEDREWYFDVDDDTGRLDLHNTFLGGDETLFSFAEEDGYLGINETTPNEKLTIDGAISLKEQSRDFLPDTGYGKVYVKDTGLYFLDSSGNEINLTHNDTEIEWNNQAIQHLRDAADGYQAHLEDNDEAIYHLRVAADGYQTQIDDVNGEVDTLESDFAQAIKHLRTSADGYQVDINELDEAVSHILVAGDGYQEQLDTHDSVITDIQNALNDGYADVAQGADGYIAFFTGDTSLAGDNDFSYNRATGKVTVNGDLETTKHLKAETLQVTDGANLGHVLTADNQGNATWQESVGANADFNKILTHSDGTIVVNYSTGNVVTLS